MEIKNWLEHRRTPGTLANVARRIVDQDKEYQAVKQTLFSMYVLEVWIRNGGHQQKTADQLGVSRGTVASTLRRMKLRSIDAHKIARHLEKETNAQ